MSAIFQQTVAFGATIRDVDGVFDLVSDPLIQAATADNTVASATSIDLTGIPGPLVQVTGSTNIDEIIIEEGGNRTLRFSGVLTIANSATLLNPGGEDIVTGANGWLIAYGLAGPTTRIDQYYTGAGYSKNTFTDIFMYGGGIKFAPDSLSSFSVGQYEDTAPSTGWYWQFTRGGHPSIVNTGDFGVQISLRMHPDTESGTVFWPKDGMSSDLLTARSTATLINKSFSDTVTIDTGANGESDVDGLVLKNEVASTDVLNQNAPLITFAATGWDATFGSETSDLWEMNEAFRVGFVDGFTIARLSWEFSKNEGAYLEKSYIDSNGAFGGAGYYNSMTGFQNVADLTGGSISSFFTANQLGFAGDPATIKSLNTGAVPLGFFSYGSTGFTYYAHLLTSGHLISGFAPNTGFTGSYLKFGKSTDGVTFSSTKFEVNSAGNVAATSFNDIVPTALSVGFTIEGGVTKKTLTVPLNATVSGTNTGDQTSVSGNAGTATSLAGGSGGTIPYQSATGTTAMLANGAAGQVLQSNGTTVAPSWVAPGLIMVSVKNVTVSLAGGVDLTTITVPAWITRFHIIGSSAVAANGAIVAETAAGTLAGATFSAWSAAGGTGTALMALATGPTAAGNMTPWTAAATTTISTTGTIYIRQVGASANNGTCSFYILIMPLI